VRLVRALSKENERAIAHGAAEVLASVAGVDRQLEIVPVRRFVLQKSVSRRRARSRKTAEARHRHRV